MFFLLSKLLYFLTQPINWIIAFLLAALFFRAKRLKKISLRVGIVAMLFFTNHGIWNIVIHYWEPETITADQITEAYDIAILLGGFSNFLVEPRHDRHNFNSSANRLTETLALYKTNKVKKILVSGGAAEILYKSPSEARAIRTYLLQMGVRPDDIIIEDRSRNTRENAVFTQQLVQAQYPSARTLLITSAFHLPRALACFEQVGMTVTPYATDYMQETTQWTPDFILLPNSWTLMRWGLLTKEWIGYVAYWLQGYI